MKNSFTLPDYNGLCIANIAKAIKSQLSLSDKRHPFRKIFRNAGIDNQVKHIILLIVDGCSWDAISQFFDDYQILRTMQAHEALCPITSVYPSTTTAAVTALACGRSPKVHGLLEWFMYFRELDARIHPILFRRVGDYGSDSLKKEGYDTDLILTAETLSAWCAKNRIEHITHSPNSIVPSAYSDAIYPKTRHKPYINLSDLSMDIRQECAQSPASTDLRVIYWMDYDVIAHKHGPDSDQAKHQLHNLLAELEKIWFSRMDKSTAAETALLITADHGQITVNPDRARIIGTKRFKSLLATDSQGKPILPWGYSHGMFVKVRPGGLQAMISHLKEILKETADIVESQTALDQGWFGADSAIHPEFSNRIGDLIVLPRGENTVWHERTYMADMKGIHGGLSPNEMLIPFGAIKISDLL